MADVPNFSGKYTLDRNEHFDEFLAANGANWLVRKMAASSSPNLDVTQTGDSIELHLHSMVVNRKNGFTVGVPFDETTQSGAEMTVTPSWEGQKLVLRYEPKKDGVGKRQTHTRELQGNELILTLQVDDVTARRIFKRI